MKFNARAAIVLSIASTVLAGCSYLPKSLSMSSLLPASATPATVTDGVMVGPSGMTLYTFDKDEVNSGKSTCIGACAVNWPPYTTTVLESSGGDFTIITRDDGRWQWAFKGKPLHYWYKDAKPGDKTGDGFNKVWRIANS